jgi:hypothetical protein
VNTEELWSAATGEVQRGYLSLPDIVRSELAEILDRVAGLKSSIATLAAADAECEKCGGICCRFGKHHFTVVDLLGYLNAEAELFSPDFENPICPYHSGYGCKMPAAFRPYNCVIFICEEVECRLAAEDLNRLRSLEQTLKELYSRIEELLGNRFENGLFITYERSLVSGEKLFRY